MAVLGACLTAGFALGNVAQADCTVRPAFPEPTLDAWQQREFAGSTDYRLIEENGRPVLAARSEGTASVLYRERKISLQNRPKLSWSWRVDGVYDGIDERTKAGDDFPARLYVVVRTGWLPWDSLALNYVWASEEPAGTDWPSPYTEKSHMIAVRSGAGETGDWVCESRDIVADFQAAFGIEIDAIDGYAVMVDGDDSGSTGTARFGDIRFGEP